MPPDRSLSLSEFILTCVQLKKWPLLHLLPWYQWRISLLGVEILGTLKSSPRDPAPSEPVHTFSILRTCHFYFQEFIIPTASVTCLHPVCQPRATTCQASQVPVPEGQDSPPESRDAGYTFCSSPSSLRERELCFSSRLCRAVKIHSKLLVSLAPGLASCASFVSVLNKETETCPLGPSEEFLVCFSLLPPPGETFECLSPNGSQPCASSSKPPTTFNCSLHPRTFRLCWVSIVQWGSQDKLICSDSPLGSQSFWRPVPLFAFPWRRNCGLGHSSVVLGCASLERIVSPVCIKWLLSPISMWISLCSLRVPQSLNWIPVFSS